MTAEQQKGREEHASVKGGRVIGEGDKGAKREQKGAKRERKKERMRGGRRRKKRETVSEK